MIRVRTCTNGAIQHVVMVMSLESICLLRALHAFATPPPTHFNSVKYRKIYSFLADALWMCLVGGFRAMLLTVTLLLTWHAETKERRRKMICNGKSSVAQLLLWVVMYILRVCNLCISLQLYILVCRYVWCAVFLPTLESSTAVVARDHPNLRKAPRDAVARNPMYGCVAI